MAVFWEEQGSGGISGGILDGGGPDAAPRARWSGARHSDSRETGSRESGRGGVSFGSLSSALLHASAVPAVHSLDRAVESDILPRLLLKHRAARPRPVSPGGLIVTAGHVLELAACSVGLEMAASDYVAGLRDQGVAVEQVYLELLGPAARHLGTQWEDDTLSFGDVTIGLIRLQRLLRALAPAFRAEAAPQRADRRALLVPAPGEQHTFGLSMVAEFFRAAGWGVWSGASATAGDTLAMVREEWFAVVGFSVACAMQLDSLAACIRRVRAVSRNAAIGIMVGGPPFVTDPELAVSVGADATATDGRQAAFVAEGLFALQPSLR